MGDPLQQKNVFLFTKRCVDSFTSVKFSMCFLTENLTEVDKLARCLYNSRFSIIVNATYLVQNSKVLLFPLECSHNLTE